MGLKSPHYERESIRRDVRNLTVTSMDPSQPPDQVALIKDLERSARAEVRLRIKAIEHTKGCGQQIRMRHAGFAARWTKPRLSSIRKTGAKADTEACRVAKFECHDSRYGPVKRD